MKYSKNKKLKKREWNREGKREKVFEKELPKKVEKEYWENGKKLVGIAFQNPNKTKHREKQYRKIVQKVNNR